MSYSGRRQAALRCPISRSCSDVVSPRFSSCFGQVCQIRCACRGRNAQRRALRAPCWNQARLPSHRYCLDQQALGGSYCMTRVLRAPIAKCSQGMPRCSTSAHQRVSPFLSFALFTHQHIVQWRPCALLVPRTRGKVICGKFRSKKVVEGEVCHMLEANKHVGTWRFPKRHNQVHFCSWRVPFFFKFKDHCRPLPQCQARSYSQSDKNMAAIGSSSLLAKCWTRGACPFSETSRFSLSLCSIEAEVNLFGLVHR